MDHALLKFGQEMFFSEVSMFLKKHNKGILFPTSPQTLV